VAWLRAAVAADRRPLPDPEVLVRAAEEHRLAPLLEQALGASAGAALGGAAALSLRALCALHRRRSRAQQAALREILDAFARRGLEVCVLKGAALAALVYPRPDLRPMGDLDLLVSPARGSEALELLRELGFEAGAPCWRQRLVSHQLPPASRGPRCDVVVEIHVAGLSYLAPGRLALGRDARVARLPAAAGGAPMPTLEPTAMLRQLVAHAVNVRQPLLLVHLADLARWIERFGDRIDWPELRERWPREHRRLAWLAQAVTMPTGELAPVGTPAEGVGVAYRGWSRQGLRRGARSGPLPRLVRDTLVPPAWWARAQYGATARTPTWWLRLVRHPAHLAHVALRRAIEG
jgi:hypothetical protein